MNPNATVRYVARASNLPDTFTFFVVFRVNRLIAIGNTTRNAWNIVRLRTA